MQRLFSLSIGLILILSISFSIQSANSQDILPSTAIAWDGTMRRIHTPILMYHYVENIPANADATRINLTVETEAFRAQMQYLRDNGYTTISLYDLYAALMRGDALPSNPVVLTFDDSYLDHYTVVFPILQEFGFKGTFFVITARADANNPEHLNWQQIREMSDAGMDMESHTKDHQEMDARDMDFIVYQVLGSIESLEYYTARDLHMFCYPVGRYDDNMLTVLRTLPVWMAVTTQAGTLHTSDRMLELPRVRISNGTTLGAFASLISN